MRGLALGDYSGPHGALEGSAGAWLAGDWHVPAAKPVRVRAGIPHILDGGVVGAPEDRDPRVAAADLLVPQHGLRLGKVVRGCVHDLAVPLGWESLLVFAPGVWPRLSSTPSASRRASQNFLYGASQSSTACSGPGSTA